jgi:hypothetical protein
LGICLDGWLWQISPFYFDCLFHAITSRSDYESLPATPTLYILFCFPLAPILSSCHCVNAEPSTGVDPVSRRGMWAVIAGAKRRRAVALTTHSLEEADALCDRIGIMCNGAMQVRV